MPKTVPADVLTQFALASIQPRYLLTIVTTGGTTLRYCTGKNNIDFPSSSGSTYYATRGFTFSTIRANLTLEVDRVQIEIDNIDGGLLTYLKEIQDARITLMLVDLGKLGSASNDIARFSGIAGAPTINISAITFPVLSPLTKLSAPFPNRQLSGPCPWVFDGTHCLHGGSTLKATETDGVVEAGSSTVKIVDATHRNEANGYWDTGTVEITSGALDGEIRQVSTSTAAGVVNIILPFSGTPAVGVTYSISRGCNKSQRDCWENHDNWINYGGFKVMPRNE